MGPSSAPRTAWEAMSQPPARLLRSAWPWRSAGYVLSGAVLGVLLGAVVAFLGAVVVIYLPFLIPVLAAALVATAGPLGRLERWRLRLVDLDPARSPRRPWTGWRGWWSDPAVWLEVAHLLLLSTVLWAMDLVATLALVGLPLIGATSVVWVWFSGEPAVLIALLLPGGLGLLLASGLMMPAYAGARAQVVRSLVGAAPDVLPRRVRELTESRARLAAAFEAERRRIERDLHDGAQQRLTTVAVAVAMARMDVPEDSPAVPHLDRAGELAALAQTELCELVHGIRPRVLTDLGLAPAIAELVERCPVPVTVSVDLPDRLPEPVEVACYFVVGEALTNIARHSGADRAEVVACRRGGLVVLRVTDDGHGGADPAAGSGLTGLSDRVAVLEGRLHLDSPPGGPTVLTVEVPCPTDR